MVVLTLEVRGKGCSGLGQAFSADPAGAVVELPGVLGGDEGELCSLHGSHLDEGV